MDVNKVFKEIQTLSLSTNNRAELQQLCTENIEQVYTW